MSTLVMTVDDEDEVVQLIRLILEAEGYDVITASSGKECLEKLERHKPDLILLDIMMPGMDGWETLRQIRKDERLKDVPVAMLTAVPLTTETLRREEIEGLVDYIVKPFTRESLLKKVEELLKSINETRAKKEEIKKVLGENAAEEYERLVKARNLHKSLINTLKQLHSSSPSFKYVIASEERLVKIYETRVRELERCALGGGGTRLGAYAACGEVKKWS
ncbi:MAG: two-component system response regulator [Candidatus Alkanophagales archaeon]|nr:MAG: two-component system response regulator [Candidatus Alkanophagales archaeon]